MRAIDADALQLAIVEEGQANKRKKYIIGDVWELTGAEIRKVINSQPTIQPEITHEQAVAYLQSTGWMQEHDRQMMLDGVRRLTAQPEPHWIPVTERLPENGRQVLVYARSVHYALAKYDEMRNADGTYKKQWVTFDAWKPLYTIKEVIAWMPLPEPFKGVTIPPECEGDCGWCKPSVIEKCKGVTT